MKKIFSLMLMLVLALTVCIVPAMAEEVREVGQLVKSNYTEEEFNQLVLDWLPNSWYIFEDNHEVHYSFFDDLSQMLLALDAGTIDEITLPRFVAEYVVRVNPELKICCVQSLQYDMSLLLGFRDDEEGQDLQKRVNEAIAAMRADGTLDELKERYLDAQTELTPVQFDSFPETDETVRIVVTGDLPPVDYIGEDNVPAGFNTAVLAEIGRRLGVNIELVSAHTGARSLALSSHVADAVFWYMMDMPGTAPDAPEGILFSDPYLDWDLWLHVRKAEP